MQIELTPEQITEMGKMWGRVYLNSLPVEQRLTGLKLEEILAALNLEEIEQYLRKIKKKSPQQSSLVLTACFGMV